VIAIKYCASLCAWTVQSDNECDTARESDHTQKIQDWLKLKAEGYPAKQEWQTWKYVCLSAPFLSFIPGLRLCTCAGFRLTSTCMLTKCRPRNEKEQPVEPRTFSAFQLPLTAPYVWGHICYQYDWQDTVKHVSLGVWCVVWA
jgi:hypothetical protein